MLRLCVALLMLSLAPRIAVAAEPASAQDRNVPALADFDATDSVADKAILVSVTFIRGVEGPARWKPFGAAHLPRRLPALPGAGLVVRGRALQGCEAVASSCNYPPYHSTAPPTL